MTPDDAAPRTLVILLRGVNVNGITVTSAALRASMRAVDGVRAARTLLASGNVVVTTDRGADEVKRAAEERLRADFGYDAWVVVVDRAELAGVLEATPWSDDDPNRHVYLTFASDPAALDEVAGLAPEGAQVARPASGVLAWTCPVGASTTDPMARLLARPRYRATTTTRNLRTVLRLAALDAD